MNTLHLYLTLCTLLVDYVTALGGIDTPLDGNVDIDEQFDIFKKQFGKVYGSNDKEDKAKGNFQENLMNMISHNLDPASTYEMGINTFSDMDPSEVIKTLCKAEPKEADNAQERVNFVSKRQERKDALDWTTEFMTPIKDQGQCGSCWAFAAIETYESCRAIQTNESMLVFSTQELLDCSVVNKNFGCAGGMPDRAYTYMQKNGIETEECYPYTGMPGMCHTSQKCPNYGMSRFVTVDAKGSEEAMLDAVQICPLSVAMHACNSLSQYKSGVYADRCCAGKTVNHAVVIMGYGTTEDGVDYWIVRNSWGPKWGKEGIFWLKRGENMCGINTAVNYPEI